MSDAHDLQRFVDAQGGGTYDQALGELRAGRKQGHWIWFVLPQVQGLGRSSTAQHYGLTGLDEARAYLAHPVLGPRLRECARALADLPGSDPTAVLGSVDALKVRSSMTLFIRAADADGDDAGVLRAVLAQYYGGEEDGETLARL
ncbi:DUF1810 domain-containing protein [uncultured Pseudokineococcus sp.]|uniref:DUF1810 domain-containing protein n=1 Tax=uncultured Pseudokineococcus sp. TaxID=1642928 RepID=UPI002636D864|nr:DUF1810 domain-containing protein [uncultured Pseudokineococcus sp.]